jgi:2-alkyl-3-oxoalkanoate reductase
MCPPSRALVTGGGGFLGSRIVSMLLDEGWSVKSFSRKAHSELIANGAGCCVGDLADESAVNEAVRDADVVFHVAAKVGLWGDYAEYHAANVTGTRNVIEACRGNGVTKLVHTSSTSVIFRGRDLKNANEDAPVPRKHSSHYASTKAQAERLVLEANSPHLATIVLRPHALWGPGDNQLLPRLAQRHRANRLMLVGRGDNLVDFTFVDNAARAHLDAAIRLHAGGTLSGRVYFISQGDPRPVGIFVNDLMRAAGLPPVTRSIPVPVAHVAAWGLETVYRTLGVITEPPITRSAVYFMALEHYFDTSAARRDLGLDPAISIEEGLRRLAADRDKGLSRAAP